MPVVSTCTCCEGISPETPVRVFNRPGLHAIAYRVGGYQQFRESLLSALSGARVSALHKLTTRNNDDFTIALLDAWAVASDVLTFYQERIANESYLHTATERLSVLQLARHIGYELRPGVAASTYLAFTLEEATVIPQPLPGITPGANPMTPVTILDAGVKIQSVPGPGEKPQTFETIETLQARPQWNSIKPRLSRAQSVDKENGFFILQDINIDIKKGDVVLIEGAKKRALKRILGIDINKEAKTTTILFNTKLSLPPFIESPPTPDGNIAQFANESELRDSIISEILNHTWKEEDLSALIQTKKWSLKDLIDGIEQQLKPKSSVESPLSVFRKTVSPFGYNAAKQVTYNGRIPKPPSEWKEWDLDEKCEIINLDNEYKEIVPGSFIAFMNPADNFDQGKIYKVESVHIGARTAYGISSKSTSVGISATGCWYDEKKQTLTAIRDITVLAQNEPLFLADLPIEDVVQNDLVTLDRWYPGLRKGQKIILTGERADLKGTAASEVMELNDVFVVKGYTVVQFTQSLLNRYVRSSVTLNANVALATHGETVQETLGSGDANIPFHRFMLRQPPLTYISSSAVAGVDSTLKVYVNDILWRESETFYGRTSEERIYITRLDNEGKTTIIFGDGVTGARLPSGSENIKAKYRKGIGTGGLVKANQLSQLLTRPLGVKGVVNPLPSTGAADAENLEEARRNAPLTLLTMGRVVSLQDYEDFSRAFPGIEKSLATWTWKNQRRYIFLTVAGVNGATLSKTDALYKNLLKAIADSGDARIPVVLESYRPRFFRFSSNLKIDPDFQSEKVLLAVEEQMRRVFSFSARSFGQPVSLSEVIASIQQVRGIVAVDVDYLYYADEPKGSFPSPLLTASVPARKGESVQPAELLTLDVAPLDLKILP